MLPWHNAVTWQNSEVPQIWGERKQHWRWSQRFLPQHLIGNQLHQTSSKWAEWVLATTKGGAPVPSSWNAWPCTHWWMTKGPWCRHLALLESGSQCKVEQGIYRSMETWRSSFFLRFKAFWNLEVLWIGDSMIMLMVLLLNNSYVSALDDVFIHINPQKTSTTVISHLQMRD